MATTNKNSKSLGNVLVESGNGTPDHTSPMGSLYSDEDNGTLYINNSGTTWQSFSIVSHGEGTYIENTTETAISAATEWFSVGNTLTTGATESNGFTVSTDTLVVDSGRDGLYEVNASVTLDWVATTPNYEIGISVNGATPVAGTYNGATISATYTTANIAVGGQMDLVGGDTIELCVRNLTDTSNVIILHADLIAYRIK